MLFLLTFQKTRHHFFAQNSWYFKFPKVWQMARSRFLIFMMRFHQKIYPYGLVRLTYHYGLCHHQTSDTVNHRTVDAEQWLKTCVAYCNGCWLTFPWNVNDLHTEKLTEGQLMDVRAEFRQYHFKLINTPDLEPFYKLRYMRIW